MMLRRRISPRRVTPVERKQGSSNAVHKMQDTAQGKHQGAAEGQIARGSLERFLFAQTQNWVVLLLLTAALAGAALFGGAVKHAAEGGQRLGAIGSAAEEIATLPISAFNVFETLLGSESRFAAPERRFEGQAGLVLADDRAWHDAGYLLASRYDGDREVNIVELVDLDSGETLHEWRPEPRRHASSLLPDGFLLSVVEGTLVMLDGCSNVQWVLDDVRFHHSLKRDADGHFWVPYRIAPPLIPGVVPGIEEDGLARISRSGTILSLVSLTSALIASGNQHLLYGRPAPMHMNDIEPVLEDGPWWRRGDLLVSLRAGSVVVLYRPSNDEVIWAKAGPWMHQHDVNVVSDHEISVFSNNSVHEGQAGEGIVLGANEVLVYDLESGRTRSPWRDALLRHEVRTITVGRSTVLENGDVFVEETNHGRALRVAADGTLRWAYVNRATDGRVYRLSWSRYLDEDEGGAAANAVRALNCP